MKNENAEQKKRLGNARAQFLIFEFLILNF